MDKVKIKEEAENLAKKGAELGVKAAQLRMINQLCKKSLAEAEVKIKYQISRNLKGFDQSFGRKILEYRERFDDDSFKKLIEWTTMLINYYSMSTKPKTRNYNSQKHKGICSSCGREWEFPFKPSPGRPSYCKQCLNKRKQQKTS